jgi:hypothetical protein
VVQDARLIRLASKKKAIPGPLCLLPPAIPATGEKGQLSSPQSVQLLKETWLPILATAKHAKRVDYEYERADTATIFMFTEPLAG